MTTEEVITCLELLRATKHSSSFRLKMEEKIRGWISKADPIVRKPFSSKEFEWLKPKWPIKYQLS